MASTQELRSRLEFRQAALDAARKAYIALLDGQVKSYAIGSRNLTRLDLPQLETTISKLEKEVSDLESRVNGRPKRRAVGVVPRDW